MSYCGGLAKVGTPSYRKSIFPINMMIALKLYHKIKEKIWSKNMCIFTQCFFEIGETNLIVIEQF